jgi:hypothetical protein
MTCKSAPSRKITVTSFLFNNRENFVRKQEHYGLPTMYLFPSTLNPILTFPLSARAKATSGNMEEMSVRRVDAKGRVYLSRKLRGSELYMAEVDDVILLSASRERIMSAVEQLAPRNAIKEYLALLEELGEPAPKEIEGLARARAWRSAEGQ